MSTKEQTDEEIIDEVAGAYEALRKADPKHAQIVEHFTDALTKTLGDYKSELAEKDDLNLNAIHALQDQVRQLRDAYAGLRGRLGELAKQYRIYQRSRRDEEADEPRETYAACANDLEQLLASTAPGEQPGDVPGEEADNLKRPKPKGERLFTPAEVREAMIRAFTLRAEVTVEQARTFIDDYLASREGGKK